MTKFYDLNVIDSCVDRHTQTKVFERAARLGYEVVAMDYKQTKLTRKTKIPGAPKKPNIESAHLKVEGKQLKVLSRLTVTLDEMAQTIALRGEDVSTYDLLAVQPTNEKMFHKACTELEIDIISCNLTTKLPFYFKHHSIKPALERGVQFEICYSPAIRDQSLRKNLFHNAISIVSACKGKNIILSSGAENVMEIRGPHDVANLGNLFGLSEDRAKASVSTNCEAVVMHAYTRNATIKSVMSVQRVTDLEPGDMWKVRACRGLPYDKQPREQHEKSGDDKGSKRDTNSGDKSTGPAGKKARTDEV